MVTDRIAIRISQIESQNFDNGEELAISGIEKGLDL